jgi:homogentisate 1,2-dioxygenase
MYMTRGLVPPKRHAQFRQPDGTLYYEELFSTAGFAGPSSLLYHVRQPTSAVSFRAVPPIEVKEATGEAVRLRLFDTGRVTRAGDALSSRIPLVFNDRETLWCAAPSEDMDRFVRNATSDELTLVVEGSGALLSPFGRLPVMAGDMVVVPRGTTAQWTFDDAVAPKLLVFESADPITIPPHLRAPSGQLLERSLFCERDLRVPELQDPVTERGEYRLHVINGAAMTEVVLRSHPFDVVGWDGSLYPFALNVCDVEPITGSLHQMPDRYQVFGTVGAVVCVVGPHKLAFHPDAITSPPAHSNIDCDELVFALSGTVPGQKSSDSNRLMFIPRGVLHGPAPGGEENSIGVERTDLTSFMVDVFRPVMPTVDALELQIVGKGNSRRSTKSR